MRKAKARKPTPPPLQLATPGDKPTPSFPGPGCPPEYFSRAERDLWETLARSAPKGLHTPLDAVALEMLCQHVTRWRATNAAIAKSGLLQKDGDRKGRPARISPLVKLAKAEAALIAQLCGQLGLTVTGRRGIVLPPQADTRTEFAKFLDACPGGPDAPPLRTN